MTLVVLLDSGPLGSLSYARTSRPLEAWIEQLQDRGVLVILPLITYYELRRELVRAAMTVSIEYLDALRGRLPSADVTLSVLIRASELWAEARRQGMPTADDRALDVDVILAATALELQRLGDEVVVATTNARHFSRFVAAKRWEEIES